MKTFSKNDFPTMLALNKPYEQNRVNDSAGRLRNQAFGNGVTQTRNYNAWNTSGGRLMNMTAGALQNLSYTYDSVGNILSITDSLAGPQVQTFAYDSLDRLTSADATGGLDGLYSETYGYDANTGNLNLKSGLSYSYLDSTHAHAVTNTSDGSIYTYDANGNQISRLRGGIPAAFSYDAENKLTQININGTPIASFIYDGDGTRVASTINGVTTRFVGEYYEVSGTDVTKYYSGKTAMRKNGVLTYLLSDHLGSNSLIVDSSGNMLSETRYKAWGEIRYSTGTTTTPYTYTGQYSNIADFGWMYYKARWYDPTLGRFAQADSIVPGASNPQSYNRYAYAANNPIKYLDSTGHWVETLLDLGFIIYDIHDIATKGLNWGTGLALVADIVCTIIPVATGGGVAVRGITHADDAVKAINSIDNIVDTTNAIDNSIDTANTADNIMEAEKAADSATGVTKTFTASNFRKNLLKQLGMTTKEARGFEAHPVFPKKFQTFFENAKIDINDPTFGALVDSTTHRKWSYQYNLNWSVGRVGFSPPTINSVPA